MSREDILTKFKTKDYNNALEEILEKKEFSNDVKNLLLNMLYKVETGYKDYKRVKIDVLDKKIIIGEIVEDINENCAEIGIVNPKEKINSKNKKFKIDYEKNSIKTYQREKDLLRAVYNLSYKAVETNGIEKILQGSFSKFMNIGHSNDVYEIIRDFDGWNWQTEVDDLENFEYNLMYQNLKILTNNEYLYSIISQIDGIVDFDESARLEIQKSVDEINTNEFMKHFYRAILILNKHRQSEIEAIIELKNEKELELEELENKERYAEELLNEKKKCIAQIKTIEETLNSPQKLNQEFIKRNQMLDNENKIFSISNLTEILVEEKSKIEIKIDKILNKMEKTKCTQKEENTKKVVNFIKNIDLEATFNKEKTMIKLQKTFLNCFMDFIKKAENKKQITELIYTFRYYCLLYYNTKTQIKDVKELKEDIDKIRKELISKSIKKKMLNELSVSDELNLQIISPIFELRNIELDNLEIKLSEDIVNTKKIKVEYLDNGIAEKTKEIDIENIRQVKGLKFKKKIKLFN